MLGAQIPLTMIRMAGTRKRSTPSAYRSQFIDRLRSLRVTSGLTTAEVAEALDVRKDTYERWESRTLMPHHLLVPFCEAVGGDLWFLLTGSPFSLGRSLARPPSARLA